MTIEPLYKNVFSVTDEKISGFFEKYRFLSNFHVHPVWYEGLEYGSTEAAYQAAKQPLAMRYMFLNVTPVESKKLSRKLQLPPDEIAEFDARKFLVMAELQIQKFKDPTLRQMLLDTGDRTLEETNYWNDCYWGVCNGQGKNKLGEALMLARAYYRTLNRLVI